MSQLQPKEKERKLMVHWHNLMRAKGNTPANTSRRLSPVACRLSLTQDIVVDVVGKLLRVRWSLARVKEQCGLGNVTAIQCS